METWSNPRTFCFSFGACTKVIIYHFRKGWWNAWIGKALYKCVQTISLSRKAYYLHSGIPPAIQTKTSPNIQTKTRWDTIGNRDICISYMYIYIVKIRLKPTKGWPKVVLDWTQLTATKERKSKKGKNFLLLFTWVLLRPLPWP